MYCETKTFTIGKFFVEKNAINLSPEYQRESGAWGREKQQLFLDTLFNQYDVPKILYARTQAQWRLTFICTCGR